MDLDTLTKIISLGTEHKWVALAILAIGWLTALTNDWSRFPITVPPRIQPLIVGVLGLAYGVLVDHQGGTDWWPAIRHGGVVALSTMGLYAIVIKAIFNDDMTGATLPKWIAWLPRLLAWLALAKPDMPGKPIEIKNTPVTPLSVVEEKKS